MADSTLDGSALSFTHPRPRLIPAAKRAGSGRSRRTRRAAIPPQGEFANAVRRARWASAVGSLGEVKTTPMLRKEIERSTLRCGGLSLQTAHRPIVRSSTKSHGFAKRRKAPRGQSSAGVIKVVARRIWTPRFEQGNQSTLGNMLHHEILGKIGKPVSGKG